MKFRCFNASQHKHMDKNHSAALIPGSGGKYWTCFACGASGDIFKAVELKESIKPFYEKLKFVSERFNVPLQYDNPENESERNYYYKDATGALLYKITRRDIISAVGREKYFFPSSYIKGTWVRGLKGAKRVLYNLPKVLEAAKNGHILYFVEGEKCAEALIKLGLYVTTVAGGVNGWGKYSQDFIPWFAGADVVIIPDNDEPGKNLGRRVQKDIMNLVKRVKYLELPELMDKEDVADWIEKGGTAERLQELADTIKEESLQELNSLINAAVRTQEYSLQDGAMAEENTSACETLQIINENMVFILKGCYCKKVKDVAVALTNFIIKPIYKLQAPSKDSSL